MNIVQKMLSILIVFLVAAALTAPVLSADPSKHATGGETSLALLDIESESTLDADVASLLTEAIRREITNWSRYTVMGRNRMEAVSREHSLKMTNCSTAVCAAEAGQLFGVKTVVAGSLNKAGKTYFLSLSRVNVQSRTVELLVEEKFSQGKEELARVSKLSVRKLLGEVILTPPRATMPENDRFVLSDVIVFDNSTKLAWLRDANVAGKTLTWDEAVDYIGYLNKQKYGGQSDWRLPDKDELATLIEYAKNQGVKRSLNDLFTKIGFRNLKADYYWSATPSTDVTGLAWALDIYGGEMSAANKSNGCYVWPIRTGPWLFQESTGAP